MAEDVREPTVADLMEEIKRLKFESEGRRRMVVSLRTAGELAIENWKACRDDFSDLVRAIDASAPGGPMSAEDGRLLTADGLEVIRRLESAGHYPERDLLAHIDALVVLGREAMARAESWECAAAQVDDVLGAKIQRIGDERTRYRRLAMAQGRLIDTVLGGRPHGAALDAVNELAAALGWGRTEVGEGSVPLVLRELVEALDARSRIGVRMAVELCADDAGAALLAKLSDREGDAEARVTEALMAARALVPEEPS